jgi:hypothetical protein
MKKILVGLSLCGGHNNILVLIGIGLMHLTKIGGDEFLHTLIHSGGPVLLQGIA